jgi:hypothetical protein
MDSSIEGSADSSILRMSRGVRPDSSRAPRSHVQPWQTLCSLRGAFEAENGTLLEQVFANPTVYYL